MSHISYDWLILVFTDFEGGRSGFPGVSLRSTLGYFFASRHVLRTILAQKSDRVKIDYDIST